MTLNQPPERSFRSRYHTQSSSPINGERKYDNKGKSPKEPSSYFGSFSTRENDSKVNIGLQSPKIPVGGRLRFFLQNWKKITDDQWVLSVIEEGYKLEFIQKPPQTAIKQTLVLNQDLDLLKLEMEE